MGKNKRKLQVPLPPLEYYILYTLARNSEELHGYEIMKNAEELMGGKDIPTATLYRGIRKLLEEELIEVVEVNRENDDPRRRYYQLTNEGRGLFASNWRHLKTTNAGFQENLFGELQPI